MAAACWSKNRHWNKPLALVWGKEYPYREEGEVCYKKAVNYIAVAGDSDTWLHLCIPICPIQMAMVVVFVVVSARHSNCMLIAEMYCCAEVW